ncbi:hypothetical protein IB211_01100 [Intestinimonas butyriciproducens]|uniref:Uncharacterized protein n=1 Tax=Intestinimonas butyriciproducens TaxID=1297617 RepID=A0A0S2W2C0_9FIRM|nr:hypothetical protein IB211_01100 [Intestinimonas butyriciproducens]
MIKTTDFTALTSFSTAMAFVTLQIYYNLSFLPAPYPQRVVFSPKHKKAARHLPDC